MTFGAIHQLLEVYREQVAGDGGDLLRQQLIALVYSVAERTMASVNVSAISNAVDETQSLDLESLRSINNALQLLRPDEVTSDKLELLRHRIETFTSQPRRNSIQSTFELELDLDPALDEVLADIDRGGGFAESVRLKLRGKLESLSEYLRSQIWELALKEIPTGDSSGSSRHQLPWIPELKIFLSEVANRSVADSLVEYLLELRPRMLHVAKRKDMVVGISGLGILRIVALANSSGRLLRDDEVGFSRVLTELIAIWKSALNEDRGKLIHIFGIRPDGLIAQSATHDAGPGGSTSQLYLNLIFCLKKLLVYCEILSAWGEPLVELLWRLKLSYEVRMPASATFIDSLPTSARELEIQKVIVATMIEHGVDAFGKKFGRSEIDIMLAARDEARFTERLLVETKLLTTPLTLSKLNGGVSQLLAYLAEERVSKGALILINRSNSTIIHTPVWHHDRVVIIPVNLCDLTPSKRVEFRVVEKDRDGRLQVRTSSRKAAK